jgi:adenylate cyclase
MQRKLSAILSADVVGYSGLMEADEEGTLERIKANRAAIFDPLVVRNGGRVFKLLGDGALVEFPSVVSAVMCALAIQDATAKGEPTVPGDQRIRYRIGINFGDIIIDGDDIYGEGVNVAARLQSLAPSGGVAVSRMVRDNLEGKLACAFDDMGEHQVKDHERPVHAFCVYPAVEQRTERRAREARPKPTICVLPFANMSGDPEQEYFSDGISEDVITDLSKVSALSVVSRNSSFQYKGKHVDLPKVARELKVSHVLEGSVRKVGGRVRITAELIDGSTNQHVWAERYDRDLNDIFALQDEISEAIVGALKLRLLPEERRAIGQRGTNSIDAYNFFLMALQIYRDGKVATARGSEAIVRLCEGAVKIDPDYARAWAMIALAKAVRFAVSGGSPEAAMAAADRAITLDGSIAEAHTAKAAILDNIGDRQGCWRELETALKLDPDSSETNMIAGRVAEWERKYAAAINYFERAARVSEIATPVVARLAACYFSIGDLKHAHENADITLARTQKALAQEPDNGTAMGYRALAFAVLGDKDRVAELVSRGVLLDPDNEVMRALFSRAFSHLKDAESTLSMLDSLLKRAGSLWFVRNHLGQGYLDFVRDDPRFKTMVDALEARLARS